MKTALLVFLAFCLTACGTPLVRDSEPTPVIVFLVYPVYLQPSADRFSECAVQQQGLSLFLTSDPSALSELPGAFLQLQLGGEIPARSDVYQIGEESIKFIINADNPTDELSTDELLAIYTGQQMRWYFSNRPEIELWSYPDEDTLRTWLETMLPGMPRLSSQAHIASDPQAILESVSANPGAIGYVPGSWLGTLGEKTLWQVKVVRLENSLAESLTQPVLVLSKQPLTTEEHALLICLQQPED